MKRMIALLLAALTLLTCAAAEPYSDVAKYYLNTYGRWWDYSPELWLEYAAATRVADPEGYHAAQAIAATEYSLPPEGGLSYGQAAEIAIQAAGGGEAYANIPCFLLEGRAVYKVILSPSTTTVELDALTGEVLGVYPYRTVDAGYCFVPNAVWEATREGYTSVLALNDDYTARYGVWWDWSPQTFVQYGLELRRIEVLTSRTARAMADTNYVLPPEGALPQEQLAQIALSAADAPGLSAVNTLYFLAVTDAEDRYLCKVILTDGANYSHAVELDPFTGEVLLVQTRLPLEGAGQFLTPSLVWEGAPVASPNG